MNPIRLLDLGLVPPIRSQTIYHAVGHAMTADSPDTIILVSPDHPYVCIGYHQDLEREVDLDHCRGHGLPVSRREVGGGAVYLDEGQLFSQWIFHHSALPGSLEDRFELYIRPVVETYQALGVAAYHWPVNDIHVAGKKIGGTGAAQMGLAEVLVGSLMFTFDKATMARLLKVSSEKMRDKIFESLEQYMTTLAEQVSPLPDRDSVRDLYLARASAALGREIVPGAPTATELALAAELDEHFVSEDWLYQKGSLRRAGVKIHEDVHVVALVFCPPFLPGQPLYAGSRRCAWPPARARLARTAQLLQDFGTWPSQSRLGQDAGALPQLIFATRNVHPALSAEPACQWGRGAARMPFVRQVPGRLPHRQGPP